MILLTTAKHSAQKSLSQEIPRLIRCRLRNRKMFDLNDTFSQGKAMKSDYGYLFFKRIVLYVSKSSGNEKGTSDQSSEFGRLAMLFTICYKVPDRLRLVKLSREPLPVTVYTICLGLFLRQQITVLSTIALRMRSYTQVEVVCTSKNKSAPKDNKSTARIVKISCWENR